MAIDKDVVDRLLSGRDPNEVFTKDGLRDDLKGFPEAINAVFPETVVQTCIVHLIRHSLGFVSWKDRKPLVPALRTIYRAKDAGAG